MWDKIARKEQKIPKGDWHTWLIMAGRGFGKTRTGAETLLKFSKKSKRIALIGQTIKETFSIMVFGHSGIVECSNHTVKVIKSEYKIIFENGVIGQIFGGDFYEQLRGPQFDFCWIDEFAKFKHPEKIWDQVMMSLRLGENPKCVITTTPKPIPILHKLVKDKNVVITKGSTFDNAKNLSKKFTELIKEEYGHTRLGAQELYGELYEYEEGCLWKKRYLKYKKAPSDFSRLVLAIDPSVTKTGDETGIILAGIDFNGYGYIVEDFSDRYTPHEWASKILDIYEKFKVDRIIAEANQGGDLIEHVLKTYDNKINYQKVHATRGKVTRAEPVVNLYERGLIYHVKYFKKLENQMLSYNPSNNSSPDRMDALVWALWALFLSSTKKSFSILK